jgi:hypothetical protein
MEEGERKVNDLIAEEFDDIPNGTAAFLMVQQRRRD